MSGRSRELDRRRGALQLRSAELRTRLALQYHCAAHAASPALAFIDGAGRLMRWLRKHPFGLAAVAALISVKRPRRMLRWARFGLRLWLWLRLGTARAKGGGTP